MGTNYYTKLNHCESCGRFDGVHLGKSSFGWQFSFQYNGGQYYKSVPEMRAWLEGKTIHDEYGAEVSHEDFWKMVEAKQTAENQNHAEYVRKEHPESAQYEHIIGGYSFTDREFS